MRPPVSSPVVPPRVRRLGLVMAAVVVLVLLLASHSFGRAVPTNNYRPPMTVDAIESGCYPLPGDARFDGLSYQIRRDRDIRTDAGPRRHLEGQYNLVERDAAEALLVAAFTRVGFRREAVRNGRIVLVRGDQRIGLRVTELPDTSASTLVRGEFVLDLPVAPLARPDDPVCESSASTKRRPDVGLDLREPLPWTRLDGPP